MSDLPFELESLSRAVNYQHWVFRTIAPFIGKRVIEIGAGIGNMSKYLPSGERLILTEMDPVLLPILERSVVAQSNKASRAVIMPLDVLNDDLAPLKSENLDTVISFNVLEHIEDDLKAYTQLCNLVKNSKSSGPRRVITFVPAHSWAYGTMDKTFGHYRRYSKKTLGELCRKADPSAKVHLRYFNTVGLLGWILNGRILKKASISWGSIAAFEGLCPFIAPIDDILHKVFRFPMGQSLLAVMEWE